MKLNKNKKILLLSASVVTLAVVAGGVYALVNRPNPNIGKSGVIPVKSSSSDTASPSPASTTTATTGSGSQPATSTGQPSGSDKATTPPQAPAGAAPDEPSGTFVSSHIVNLSSSNIESQCVTLPGAVCTITFTKDSVTKNLPAQATNTDGSTTWNWNPKQAGLTTGAWHITAKAELNGQTKTTNDLQDLKVE